VLEPTALLSLLSYRESSAGTHGVIVFAFISGTKCWNSRRYCLCSRSSFQGTLRAAARVTSEMKGFFASDGKIPTVENRSWQNFLNALAELPKMDLA